MNADEHRSKTKIEPFNLRLSAFIRGFPSKDLKYSDIDEMTGNRSCCRHRRAYQMRAPTGTLTALKVAVRRRGATFAGFQTIGVHRQTHGTTRLAPLETGLGKDTVQALGFRLALDQSGTRHDERELDAL